MYNNPFGFNPYYQPPKYTTPPVAQPITQPVDYNTTPNIPQPVQPRTMLNGKTVDSIDVVKATDIPFDGSISYFPLTDGSAIVTKQLQNDGTSKLTVFKPVDEQKEEIRYITPTDLEKAIDDLKIDRIDDIKDDLKELKDEFKDFKKNKKRDD